MSKFYNENLDMGYWADFDLLGAVSSDLIDNSNLSYDLPHYLDNDEAYFVEYPGYIRLYWDLKRYQIDNNPIWLYRIFEVCHNSHIYPPAVVMEWLAKGILHHNPNEIPKRLNLKPKRGNRNLFTEFDRRQKTYRMMMEVFILNHYAGVNIPAAIEGAFLRNTRHTCDIPDIGWLEDQYRRYWKKYFISVKEEFFRSYADPYSGKSSISRFLDMYPIEWRKKHVLKS